MTVATHVRPVRLQRSQLGLDGLDPGRAVFVGPGSKWSNPFRKHDADALRIEPDIAAAYEHGGWKQAVIILYREHLAEAGLDPRELRGKDLVCTCKLSDPCHADVLLELANTGD